MSFEIPDPLRILMDDDPLLRTSSAPITAEEFGEPVSRLIAIMLRIVDIRGARGLAAVQIGVPVRVIVAKLRDETCQYFINPTLDRTLNRDSIEREGCLSIVPHRWGDVSRPAKCDATWFDAEGQQHSATLTGELARIFQHEFDHLNGVLMTDRRSSLSAMRWYDD